jgi:ribosome-binding factor A
VSRPPSERMRKVNEALREVLAEGIDALGDPGIGFVTVTGVRATSDFSEAAVYVSVLGNEKKRERSLRSLERAHGVLQARVARELRFRRTPLLTFHYDETLDRALRMNDLLEQERPAVEDSQ